MYIVGWLELVGIDLYDKLVLSNPCDLRMHISLVSLVNSTHDIQLNWQSNRTGMLCCFCALLSLLLLISAAFLFALWVLSGVYCMWGAKGFLVGNTSSPPYPTPPLLPPPKPLQEITPKKELEKKNWMKFIHIYTVWGWKAVASKRCVKCSKTLQNCTSNYRPLLLGKWVNILAINLYPTFCPSKESNDCYALPIHE